MKKELAVVGVAAACVACCALPLSLLASTIAATAGAGLAGFKWGWQVGLASLVLAVGVTSLVVWRRVRRTTCAADDAAPCGCSSAPEGVAP